MKRFTLVKTEYSSNRSVPRPFTIRSRSGWSTEFWLAKKAARWKTICGRSKNTRLSFTSSRMSPSTNRIPGSEGTFQRTPEDRSSRMMTCAPSSARARVRLEPMAPAPPVTRMILSR